PSVRTTPATTSNHSVTTASPAAGQGLSLVVPGPGLHSDDRTLVQLLEGPGADVGAGAAHAGGDLVEQVLDAGAGRVDQHPRARDALLEQALARPVEGTVVAAPGGHCAGRRHAEALLVGPTTGVGVQVARALVGPGEP